MIVGLMNVSSAAAFDNQDLIDYRRHVMLALGDQVAAINLMVQKKVPATDFALHAQALAITAAQAKSAFESEAEGGNSKSEVWKNWADFSKRLDAMTSATAIAKFRIRRASLTGASGGDRRKLRAPPT